jgi:tetratricopeptide (TPR) repeat protein
MLRRAAPNWFAQVKHFSPEEAAASLPPLRLASRELLSRELVSFLEEASLTVPLILFLDDLHWADESTLDLLRHVSNRFDVMGILILANYRPEELQLHNQRFLQVALDLQARRRCQRIELGFLGVADVEAFLALEFTQNNFPPVFPRLIQTKTEGNPFFMVEVLRYLRDKQVISLKGDTWTLSEKLPDIERDLPQSIVGMVQRKVDILSDSDRRLLSAASIQGFEFDSPVVARTLAIDPADTEERLDSLHRVHGIVQPLGERELPQGTVAVRYRFVHFLYYGALYNAIQPARKAAWSGTAASALLHFHEGHVADIASQVGFLFESARDFLRAATHFSLAAEHAFRIFAFGEAELLARRGLRMLEILPKGMAESEEKQGLQRRLLVILGNSLLSGKGFGTEEVHEVFIRARDLCRGDSPRLFGPLWGLQTYFVSRLAMDSATDISGQLLKLAANSDDPSVKEIAHLGAGVARYLRGEIDIAREHFQHYRELDDPSLRVAAARRYGLEPGIMLRAFEARAFLWMGQPEKCNTQLEAALSLARALSHAPTMAFVMAIAATTQQWHRDVERVEELARELVNLGAEHGMQVWLTEGSVFDGWVQFQRGQESAGIQRIKENIAGYAATGTEMFLPIGYAILAETCRQAGRFEEGLQAVRMAHQSSWWSDDCRVIYAVELVRVEGDLLAASGQREQAEQKLTRSLEIARQRQLRPLELRAALSLSRLWRSEDPARARAILAPVCAIFSNQVNYTDLQDAESELRSLSFPT